VTALGEPAPRAAAAPDVAAAPRAAAGPHAAAGRAAAAAPRAATPPRPAVGPLPADLLYGRLLASAVSGACVRQSDGRVEPLEIGRWLADADAVDREILADVEADVLDLGCGPGRHLAALRAAGKRGLGVDLSPVAVAIARGRGADAINASLWSRIPGLWRTVLLLDGNIGIGGAPISLLRRAGELLEPGGAILVEVDPPGAPTHRIRVRLEAHGVVSEWFRWARVGADGVAETARRAGFHVETVRALAGRTFVTLRRE
jgi:SAM-dependent methyltransferase